MNWAPIVRDVVLVGGGHSHVLFIRMWAMQPMPGVRLTLISEKIDTPYSGMLPGLIAGHYRESDVHIDLARLCSWANVRFIEQRVTKIDLNAKAVQLGSEKKAVANEHSTRPNIEFDVLSLDTGSTPELSVPGSEQFSVPVKPVHGFYQRWQSILARLQTQSQPPLTTPSVETAQISTNNTKVMSVGVVGSGAGGFELIMAMRYALSESVASCHWVVRGERVIKDRPENVSEKALQAAKVAGVVVHTSFDVVDVKQGSIQARDGRSLVLDEIVWCAAAQAPQWPREAGFEVDKRGFVLTNAYLQSVSADFVFATGDIGTQQQTPSDKAGVFAVRQAPVLFQNIRRYLLGTKLKVYRPQKDFLSLMATGHKAAIGNRGFVTVQGAWVWRMKDAIDQKFMNQFRALPAMHARQALLKVPQALLKNSSVTEQQISGSAMRCRGCGAKVGPTILDTVLREITSYRAEDVISGLADGGDAAVINTHSQTLVQSVDQLSSVCDDPYVFGRIAAVHALSDVLASGAQAHSAQVLVSLPFADQSVVKRDLQQLMAGVVDALNEDGCELLGGHTSEADTTSLGFVVNGFAQTPDSVKSANAVDGDHLILTKPLGSGVLLAGMMQQLAAGRDVAQVFDSMQLSNRAAAVALYQHGAVAVTDVTGFGLLGHLHRLLEPLDCGAIVQVHDVPLFNGAMALAQKGVASTLLHQNQAVFKHISGGSLHHNGWKNLLCDPQTSGGLLGIVPASQSDLAVAMLRDNGYEAAGVVGKVVKKMDIQLELQ